MLLPGSMAQQPRAAQKPDLLSAVDTPGTHVSNTAAHAASRRAALACSRGRASRGSARRAPPPRRAERCGSRPAAATVREPHTRRARRRCTLLTRCSSAHPSSWARVSSAESFSKMTVALRRPPSCSPSRANMENMFVILAETSRAQPAKTTLARSWCRVETRAHAIAPVCLLSVKPIWPHHPLARDMLRGSVCSSASSSGSASSEEGQIPSTMTTKRETDARQQAARQTRRHATREQHRAAAPGGSIPPSVATGGV